MASVARNVIENFKLYRKAPEPKPIVQLKVASKPRVVQYHPPTANAVQLRREICDEAGITVEDLLGRWRSYKVVSARRTLAKKLRSMGWSIGRIGQFLGNRHHTSVIHLLKTESKVARGRKARGKAS